MKKIKISFLPIFILFSVLSCTSIKIRYTYIPENKNSSIFLGEEIVLYLYNEKGIKKDITLITDNGVLLYSNNGELKRKSPRCRANPFAWHFISNFFRLAHFYIFI